MTEPSDLSQVDVLLGARPRNRTRRLLRIGLLLVALATAATLLLRFMEGNTTPYYMLPVARGDLHPRLSLKATVRLGSTIAVRAQWDGVIASAPAAVGAAVTRGQPLVYVEDPSIARTIAADRVALAAARDERARAAVSMRSAAARLARFDSVWRKSQHRVPSLNEMERARADAARAALALRRARVLLDADWNRLRADRARQGAVAVRAPADGVVAMLPVAAGSWVHAGQTVLELAPQGVAQQIVAPFAAAVGPLAAGAQAQVDIRGGAAARAATLLRVDTDGTGGQRAVFALAPGPFAPPGAHAIVDMDLPLRHHVLLVPDAALAFAHECSGRHGQPGVWLWKADGTARNVRVVTGPGDGRHTQVVAGDVKPGDLVIIGWREPPRPGCARPVKPDERAGAGRSGTAPNEPPRP